MLATRRLLMIVGLLLSTMMVATGAERRVALVVGVAAYQHAPQLANAESDAKDISAALQKVGFTVEAVVNPDRLQLEAAVRRLGEASRGAEASLFYFAGHAIEITGRNWLLPKTAELKSIRDVRFEALDLDSILEQMSAAQISLVFMDACRDNPFRNRLTATSRDVASRGLGRIDAVTGSLIAFSTAPGTVADDGTGRNSPFTAAVLKNIEKPGLEVRQFLSEVRREVREATKGRQVPWESSALEGQFFFKATLPVPTPPTAAAPPVPGAAAPAPSTSAAPGSPFSEGLKARILAVAPTIAADTPERQARLFEGYRQNRAMAASPSPPGVWSVALRDSIEAAQDNALEACQVGYGRPCALLAVNRVLQPMPANGNFTVRDMPRVRYQGHFDPDRIPAATSAIKRRADVLGYMTAKFPKAAAYHPSGGSMYIVTGAGSQKAAEEQALANCNGDRSRNSSGPCFLYAVASRVILTHRLTKSRAPATTIADAVAMVSTPSIASSYRSDSPPKALAVHVESGRSLRWHSQTSAEQAERLALEGCQLRYGSPCVLIARDEELRSPDPYAATKADMPRIRYAGPFRLDMIPFQSDASKNRLLTDYAKNRKPKAIAIGLGPTRLRVGTGKTAAEAERNALAACNDADPYYPCYLYAVNDLVILPERRIEGSR